MKKILLLLLPMFTILALVFTIRDKEISWVSFLNFIQDLRFDNAVASVNTALADLQSAAKTFGSIANSGGILQVVKSIATGMSKLIVGSFHMVKAVIDLFIDIGNNLFKITDFLFGATIKTVKVNGSHFG